MIKHKLYGGFENRGNTLENGARDRRMGQLVKPDLELFKARKEKANGNESERNRGITVVETEVI